MQEVLNPNSYHRVVDDRDEDLSVNNVDVDALGAEAFFLQKPEA